MCNFLQRLQTFASEGCKQSGNGCETTMLETPLSVMTVQRRTVKSNVLMLKGKKGDLFR